MLPAMREALLAWYDAAARDLPWRRTRDAYAIWVSEVMLQQTRVDTVIPYYGRFLERFPTPRALAAATEDEVMSAWSGLGYYRRARLLHQGVREVVARYSGTVPTDAEARLALPGIGRYTAGAIGSIAFEKNEAIVDGNVARVLSRVHGIETPLGRADTEASLWRHAEALVQGPRPGALNQALMELGALVCTKAAPRCAQCPVRASCVAYREGKQEVLPVPRARKAPKEVKWVAVIARTSPTDPRFWIVRGDKSLFGGLWGLPMGEGESAPDARRVLDGFGLGAELEPLAVGHVEHVLTHRRLRVAVYRGTGAKDGIADTRRLVDRSELKEVGVSRLTHRLLDAGAQGRLL